MCGHGSKSASAASADTHRSVREHEPRRHGTPTAPLASGRRCGIRHCGLRSCSVVGFRELTRPEPEKTLVAVLQKDAQSPAFLVSVDLEKKLLTIRAVAAPHASRQELRAVARPRRPQDAALARRHRRSAVHRGAAQAYSLCAADDRGRDARRQPRARGRLADGDADRPRALCRQADPGHRVTRAQTAVRGETRFAVLRT